MIDFGTDWWEIVVRTAVVYAAVLGGIRITGKRQIGQMAPFDLVLILLIANAVQNAMVGPDTSLVGGLLAALVLLLLNLLVGRLNERLPFIERFLEGTPAVLVSDGQMVEANMRKEGIDRQELEQAIREHGVADIAGVELAVLEIDGDISVVPKSEGSQRTRRHFRQLKR